MDKELNDQNSKENKNAYISFKCKFETSFGQTLNIVGNQKELGNWDPQKSIPLKTGELYPIWETTESFEFPKGTEIYYKYIIKSDEGRYIWEYLPGNEKRHITISTSGKITICDEKDNLFGKIKIESKSKKSNKNLLSNSKDKIYVNWKDIISYDTNLINKVNTYFFEYSFFKKNQILTGDDKIILVTSLLPIEIYKSEGLEKYKIRTTNDNLVYMILYHIKTQKICGVKWVGMLRNFLDFTEEELEEINNMLIEKDIYMVFPTEQQYKDYWIYIDKILTPIFISSSIDITNEYFLKYESYFNAYREVNWLFVDVINNIQNKHDLIMLNDIHLALLPNALLPKTINAKVGIYFHTFFPSSDVMKNFPYHIEILKSILLCDVIGFHVFHYARNFLTIINREFGLDYEIKPKGFITINHLGRYILLHVMHAGVDINYIQNILSFNESATYQEKYKKIINGRFSLLSFDNTFELPELLVKFEAFKTILRKNPEMKQKIVLLQILTFHPSNNENGEIIHNEISQIKREFGEDIIYVEEYTGKNTISVQKQLSLMSVSNILLIFQMWQGLCTLANQFLVLQNSNKTFGLVLSESVGVSNKIKTALRVNPFNKHDIIKAIETIYNSNYESIKANYESDICLIKRNSTFFWIKNFFSDLKRITACNSGSMRIGFGLGLNYKIMRLGPNFSFFDESKFTREYHVSSCRLFFLDYEGTLQESEEDLGNEILEKRLFLTAHKPSENLINILSSLLKDPKNFIYIITGREKFYLTEWFKCVDGLGLGAEYGFFYKDCKSEYTEEYKTLLPNCDWAWKDAVRKIMQDFTDKTEGSVFFEKESSLSWSYKNCNPDFGYMQGNEIKNNLMNIIGNSKLEVVKGKDYVEVKPRNINKGYFISHIIKEFIKQGKQPDLILSIGDDTSDEEMFRYLNYVENQLKMTTEKINISTITVGKKTSFAKYYVSETSTVVDLLDALAHQIDHSKNIVTFDDRKFSL